MSLEEEFQPQIKTVYYRVIIPEPDISINCCFKQKAGKTQPQYTYPLQRFQTSHVAPHNFIIVE